MLKIKKSVHTLVEEATAEVTTLTPAEVDVRRDEEGVLLVDLRDIRELQRDGTIPGALHVPRGMLEFWIDPESSYYRKEFDTVESVILYCNKGARSALAVRSLQSMGIESAAHMAGGFERWLSEIGRVETLPKRHK
ncbi:MAG: rhodanese-like domain-containing protein [Gammaproteobacteria bacterium]|nr:rhodanese-like domain-containing protein [Gammaproteobacteria bacterium]MCY4358286.1 rhodanese-like domain-containing protein [Gammaproteobacteria bacterium]